MLEFHHLIACLVGLYVICGEDDKQASNVLVARFFFFFRYKGTVNLDMFSVGMK